MCRRRGLSPAVRWPTTLAVAALVQVACVERVTDPTARLTGNLALQLSAPSGPLLQQVPAATVLDSLELVVRPEGSPALEFGRRLQRGDAQVRVDLTVPPGRHTFEARLLSGSGILLFAGDTVAEIRRDNFEVLIEPRPVAPVLVVAPGELEVRAGSIDSSVAVRNAGLDGLVWQIDRITTPQGPCSRVVPCITVLPLEGELRGGESTPLVVRPGNLPPQTFTVGFTSPEGSVELIVRVTN